MVTFLLILAGLIAFNFILLKFSMQSVDADKKKANTKKGKSTTLTNSKNTSIPKAA